MESASSCKADPARWSENAFLLDFVDLILTPGLFATEGELQTVTGYDRAEYSELRAGIADSAHLFHLQGSNLDIIRGAAGGIHGYPIGADDLIRRRLGLGGDGDWYGAMFERLLPFMPDYRD